MQDYQNNFKNLSSYKISGSRIKHLSNLRFLQLIRNNLQALWYVIFTSIYIWCIFWVSYDLFFWNKTIFEVNIITFAGSVVSILFLWTGTIIWKKGQYKKQTYKMEHPYEQNITPINTPQTEQQTQPQTEQQTQPQTKTTESKCSNYCGYLKNRDKSEEIPEECFICEKLIQCSSASS